MGKIIRVLFQGDSITDAGRNRLGRHSLSGYAKKTARLLRSEEGLFAYSFFNRGISGDRTISLLKRYQRDFVRIKPDIVTIMIGINDVWRKYDSNDPTSSEDYRTRLTQLVTDLKKDTGAKVILLSPYLTPDPKGKHDEMRADVDLFIKVCEEVASRYADAYINTDIPMNEGAQTYSPAEISADGVHPKERGQEILAKLLSEKIKSLS